LKQELDEGDLVSEHDGSEEILQWLEALDSVDYYELLGVTSTAKARDIQLGFHQFSQSFHPDQHRRKEPTIQAAVTKVYKRGAEAYGVLRDDDSRSRYDLGLSQGTLRLASTTSGVSTEVVTLESVCSTPAGRLHARQIERALVEGKKEEAILLIEKVRLAEGENLQFEGRLALMWGRRLARS
jgi:curved DNA-binding protein CbpA